MKIVQSAERGYIFKALYFQNYQKTLHSCWGRPSGKIGILCRSLNVPDIIKLATHLQVSSATYRYFCTHSSGHVSVNLRCLTRLYIASKSSVKVDSRQTCSLSVKVIGLTCMSTSTWPFFIFVPSVFVLVSFIFPFFHHYVYMKAVKVRIHS